MDLEDARAQLEGLIAEHPQRTHLRVKKHGSSLVLSSGTGATVERHARLTRLAAEEWGLSFPHHSGRWERTPFAGSLRELWQTLVTDFPWYLEAVENQGRTCDPSN
jgi:hypothetical protein